MVAREEQQELCMIIKQVKFVESAERNHWYRYTISVFVLQLYLECVFQLNFCLNLYYCAGTVN